MSGQFVQSLARLLSGGNQEAHEAAHRLVRKIDTDPGKRGDFALPSLDNLKVWKHPVDPHLFEELDRHNCTLEWPVESAVTKGSTLVLRLQRAAVFQQVIRQIVQMGVTGGSSCSENRVAVVTNNELQRCSPQLSKLRTIQVSGVVTKLLQAASANCHVKVGCSDTHHLSEKGVIPLQVGHVVDLNTKQKSSANFADVYQQFYDNLMDVARERGGHVSPLSVHHTAAAEIQFQLLAKNLKLPATLDPQKVDQASFVLYNNARIVQIFGAFNQGCRDRPSESLPDVTDADFSLLTEEEEWELVFNGVLPYLDFLEAVRNECSSATLSNVNKIVATLTGMANCFSKYYRRVRILKSDPQPQVLQVMHARLFLILVLRIVNEHAFGLLGIQALKQM